MSPLKKFILHSGHYFSGNAAAQLFGLISFPILTRVLSEEQYGILGLITITMSIMVSFSKAGVSEGIIRFYTKYSQIENLKNIFASTVVFRGILFSIIITLIYFILFNSIKGIIDLQKIYYKCFNIVCLFLLIRPINLIVLNMLRAQGRTIFLNSINFLNRVTSFSLSIIFLLYLFAEFYGYFIGLVASEYIISIILLYWFFKSYKINLRMISRSLSIDIMKFGIPIFFAELSYLMLSYADRYMIMAIKGEYELGIYSVGYNLAMYLAGMITFSINSSIAPIYISIFEKEGIKETEKFLSSCMYYISIIIIPVCFGYFAISKELIGILASQKFIQCSEFSYIILIGNILLGINTVMNAGLYIRKKTLTILIINLIAIVINIALNFYIIPILGGYGAAIATLISCAIITILTTILSLKEIRIKFNFTTIGYYILASIIMIIIIETLHVQNTIILLVIKIAIGVSVFSVFVLIKERDILYRLKNYCSK